MKLRLALLLTALVAAALGLSTAFAQSASGVPTAQLTLANPGGAVPWFRITLDENGSGEYSFTTVQGQATDKSTQHFQVNSAAARKWIALAQKCRPGKVTELKKVAYTGHKVLVYTADGQSRTVEWDSAREQEFSDISNMASALSETLQAGLQFSSQLRYGRVQLDSTMESWQRELASGSAICPEAIADTLSQISADPLVMARVRRAADNALAQSGQSK